MVAETEAACAPNHCNAAGDCTDVVLRVSADLAGPPADQATTIYCGVFFVSNVWPQFGAQGCADRLNCYYDLPPELQLGFLSSTLRSFKGRKKGLKGSVLAGIVSASIVGVVIAFAVALGAVFWRAKRRRESVSRESNREILGAQLSNFQGMEPVQWFSFSELRAATKNFQESLLIGKGGSGKVYLGTLPNKLHVAVKEITSVSKPGVVEVRRI